jgi:hypothetical protein
MEYQGRNPYSKTEEVGSLTTSEKVRILLDQLILESKPIQNNEKLYLIGAVKLEQIRITIGEYF